MGTRLLLVPVYRTGGNGHTLKYMKFHLNMKGHFFTVRMIKHWNRLPREVVKSPSVEMLRGRRDTVIGYLLYLTLLEQRGWA